MQNEKRNKGKRFGAVGWRRSGGTEGGGGGGNGTQGMSSDKPTHLPHLTEPNGLGSSL